MEAELFGGAQGKLCRDLPSLCGLQAPAYPLSIQPVSDMPSACTGWQRASASVSLPGVQLICQIQIFDCLLVEWILLPNPQWLSCNPPHLADPYSSFRSCCPIEMCQLCTFKCSSSHVKRSKKKLVELILIIPSTHYISNLIVSINKKLLMRLFNILSFVL